MTSLELLKITGALEQVKTTVKQQASALGDTAEAHVIESMCNDLVVAMCKRMDAIYTQDELYKLVLFYNTDLGKALIAKQSLVAEAMMEEIQTYLMNTLSTLAVLDEASAQVPKTFN